MYDEMWRILIKRSVYHMHLDREAITGHEKYIVQYALSHLGFINMTYKDRRDYMSLN